MAKLQHTPGPWSARANWAGADVRNPHGVAVAWCSIAALAGKVGSHSVNAAEAAANAHLIAAAPEMYQLLRDIWDVTTGDPNPAAGSRTLADIEALLHRLEGE
jgi:hypothetical protein